jgi:hypothetical protein
LIENCRKKNVNWSRNRKLKNKRRSKKPNESSNEKRNAKKRHYEKIRKARRRNPVVGQQQGREGLALIVVVVVVAVVVAVAATVADHRHRLLPPQGLIRRHPLIALRLLTAVVVQGAIVIAQIVVLAGMMQLFNLEGRDPGLAVEVEVEVIAALPTQVIEVEKVVEIRSSSKRNVRR